MMSKRLKKKSIKIVGLFLTILSYLLIFTPIFVIFVLSVNASTKGYSWEGFTLRWYIELFETDTMAEPIMNTLFVALSSTVIATVLGTLFAI